MKSLRRGKVLRYQEGGVVYIEVRSRRKVT